MTINSTDAGLKDLRDTMNRCRDMAITYQFGETEEVLPGQEITSWLTGTVGGEIQVDREKAAGFVKALADKYDTKAQDL